MLSTKRPSLDKKLKVLKDIASENDISLENEEDSSIITQVKYCKQHSVSNFLRSTKNINWLDSVKCLLNCIGEIGC